MILHVLDCPTVSKCERALRNLPEGSTTNRTLIPTQRHCNNVTLLSAYYILNTAVIATYPLFSLWAQHEYPRAAPVLVGWGKQAVSTLGIMAAVVLRKANIDSFVSDILMFTKSAILLLSWMMDQRIFSWYCVMHAMLFLHVRKPEHRGPSKIEWLNPASLKRLVLEPKDDDKKVSWLVEFYASWSLPCVNLEPTFAGLSVSIRLQS